MISVRASARRRASRPPGHGAQGTAEGQVLDLCVRLCALLGMPKSVGLIYGSVFVSSQAVTAEQLVWRLKISRGSVSTGLRFLRELGAIRVADGKGERAEHFVAEEHLRGAVENFVSLKIAPAMAAIGEEMEALTRAPQDGVSPELREKLETLRRWHGHGRLLLPMLTGFLKTLPLFLRK